jgi:universal stress protein A
MRFESTKLSIRVAVDPGEKDVSGVTTPSKRIASPRLQTILVPVLFSDSSKNLFRHAIPFAQQFNARIIVLHVLAIHYAIGWGIDVSNVESPFDRDVRKGVERRLTALARETIPGTITVQTQARYGTPSTEIVSVAKEFGADLIILSTHGHKRRINALIGSVSGNVTRLATCPVLLVREQEMESNAGQPNPFKSRQNLPSRAVAPGI